MEPTHQAELAKLREALEKSESVCSEFQRIFDLTWEADMRAIKVWQAANPGNDLIWPDRAKLTLWLLEQITSAREVMANASNAMKPFATAAKIHIPAELPDDLWTQCKAYPTPLDERVKEELKERGIELAGEESELLLWIDGHPISDFRRALTVFRAIEDVLKGSPSRRRVRHVKRGSTYQVVGEATLQTEVPISDPIRMVVYRADRDGALWVRPMSEFHDGRFVEINDVLKP
jgi:hypothetical protein